MELKAQIITRDMYKPFIQEKDWAVVLTDTEWDIRGKAKIQPTFRKAIKEYNGIVAFGQFDPDVEVDLAQKLNIKNVPTLLYYRKGGLVAALLSASQNVSARIKALINDEKIGYHDGYDFI